MNRDVPRVPVIRQAKGPNCGAACLGMVLAYFGLDFELSTLIAALAPTDAGSTAFAIVAFARAAGLNARGWAVPFEQLSGLPVPAIVHVMQNHYVVLEAVGRDWFEIVDPGSGRKMIQRGVFQRVYSGVVMTFA